MWSHWRAFTDIAGSITSHPLGNTVLVTLSMAVVVATSDENPACFIHHVSWLPYFLYVLFTPQNFWCTCSLQGFHCQQKCVSLETAGQEMLLEGVNGLVVCKD